MNIRFYKERLLNDRQLKRLSEHKYSCVSESLLDPWLQPWWNWLVSKTPLWLAPNLITILGLIVNIVTTLILVWYSPDARSEPPRWACVLCAVGVFVYQSLDAIDGKQARRTGTQSPLGELFDHGCDSISTVFVALAACISVRLGDYPTWMFFQCFSAMSLFYCAHWQTYVSGTLRLGRLDVTEAQYSIMLIHLVSGTLGPAVWAHQWGWWQWRYLVAAATAAGGAVTLLGLAHAIRAGGVGKNGSTVAIPGVGGGASYSLVACALVLAAYLHVLCAFCRRILHGGCGKNGSTVAELTLAFNAAVVMFALWLWLSHVRVISRGGVGRNGSTVAGTSILSPVIPFSLVVVPAFVIFQKSESQVYENHPALYILAFGMVCAKVTNKLVVAHMSKSEMEYLDWSLLGPAMLFMNQYFNTALPEYYVLWLCLAWVVVDLVRYSGQVCVEICDHLAISLFTIPYPPPPLPHRAGTHAGTHAAADRNGSDEEESDDACDDFVPLIK